MALHGVAQDLVQCAATLYEHFYCTEEDQDEEPEEQADGEVEERTLSEMVSTYPAYRCLLQAFPTKEDEHRKLSWPHRICNLDKCRCHLAMPVPAFVPI